MRHLVRPQSPSPHCRAPLAQPVGKSHHVAGRADRRNMDVFAAAVQGRQTVLHPRRCMAFRPALPVLPPVRRVQRHLYLLSNNLRQSLFGGLDTQ